MASREVRERRAAHARVEARRQKTRSGVRYALYALLALALMAGAVLAVAKAPDAPEHVHWHAQYDVYVHGERVSFAHPAFDAARHDLDEPHLHAPDYGLVHVEGAPEEGTLGRFFADALGGRISDDELVLAPPATHAGTYAAGEAGNELQVWARDAQSGAWTRVEAGYADTRIEDGARYLVLYGSYTADEVRALQGP